MKNPPLRILLAAAIGTGLGIIVWSRLPAALPTSVPAPEPSRPAMARHSPPPAPAEDDSAARLVARQIEWSAITDSATADKIEVDLEGRLTDGNSAAIVRALPPRLLETPFGFSALERWATLDRAAALEWLGRRENSTPFQLRTVLRGWTARDRDTMHSYATDVPEGPWRERVLAEMSAAALRTQEPLEAVSMLRAMKPGESQTRLLKDSVALWARDDPESASDWVDKVGDPALQRQLIRMTAIGYAFLEPKAATEWLQQSLPAGDELNQAMGDVVEVWTGDGRAADAAAWVAAQPEGGMRDAAVKKLVARWEEFNPGDAQAWVRSLPAGSLQQQAATALTNAGTASR